MDIHIPTPVLSTDPMDYEVCSSGLPDDELPVYTANMSNGTFSPINGSFSSSNVSGNAPIGSLRVLRRRRIMFHFTTNEVLPGSIIIRSIGSSRNFCRVFSHYMQRLTDAVRPMNALMFFLRTHGIPYIRYRHHIQIPASVPDNMVRMMARMYSNIDTDYSVGHLYDCVFDQVN